MAKSKRKNLSFNFLNRFMIIQFILMLALSLFITKQVSSSARENAKEHLSAIANERVLIVTEYVDSAESKLRLFAVSPQVRKVLEDPSDASAREDAAAYTKIVANEINGVEGLYIADWDSMVLAHSVDNMTDKSLYEDEELKALQTEMRQASPNLYNAGIVPSPTSGEMVFAIYLPVYATDNPQKQIGFVGLTLTTDNVMNKLAEITTPGLEHSTYTMMDVMKRAYIFDEENVENNGQPVVLPDLVRTCEEYSTGVNTDISTTYEYSLPHVGSFIGASVWVPERNWILMMNDQKAEVYKLVYAMRMFLGIFSLLILALMVLFAFLNKKQEQVNLKLVTSVERMNQAKQSLNSTMFSDVLTEVNNRVKLTIDLSDVEDGRTNPYYFAMFNLMDFSNINTAFGSDTGDDMLVRTAEHLKETFPNGEVYRTGSDEFVVMVRTEDGKPHADEIIALVDTALRKLIVPQSIEGIGTLYPKYKVAVIKRNTDINPSVVTILKEMTNTKGEAVIGMIDFNDLSE